ncbi:hypothetical protein DFH09DRAFT_1193920 [Mycena vulgaris]|nr:hypothetical protein DFH09DRAFT_1193920 [Mycena vulgaris]
MAIMFFSCDGCSRSIASSAPRIHCLDCADYDLCADCAVGEQFTHTHDATHRTRVFKMSGGGRQEPVVSVTVIVYAGAQPANPIPPPPAIPMAAPAPPPASPSPSPSPPLPPVPHRVSMPPPLPQRPSSSSGVSTLSSVGVSSHTMPPRDEAPPYSAPPYAVPSEAGGVSSHTMPPRNEQPAYVPPPHAAPPPAAPPPAAPPNAWGSFFLDDMSPTPVFVHLMTAFFTYLDTGRTGYLVPEAYSRFLSDQGYVGQENTWAANLTRHGAKSKEAVADAALRRVFDLFSIEYTLRPRARGSAAMPLLTLDGFIAISSIEMLCDPSAHWGNLSRVLRLYGLPGLPALPLPRTVLPETAEARMLDKVARVTQFSREQGQRELAAVVARTRMQELGRQNALDLIDGPRYYYR